MKRTSTRKSVFDKVKSKRGLRRVIKRAFETKNDKVISEIRETLDYAKFTSFIKNRGSENGKCDKKRVDAVIDKMGYELNDEKKLEKVKDSVWVSIFGVIFVNKDGVIIDGHHRFEALKKLGKAIPYIVLDDELVNPTGRSKKQRNLKLAVIISNLNDTDSSWTAKEHYLTALFFGVDLAVLINKSIANVSQRTGIETKNIVAKHIYGLITRNYKQFSNGKKVTVGDYCDNQLVIDAQSSFFQNTLDFYSDVLISINNSGSHKNKVLSVIFEVYFDPNNGFDTKRLINALSKSNIEEYPAKRNDIKRILNRVYNHEFIGGRKPKVSYIF